MNNHNQNAALDGYIRAQRQTRLARMSLQKQLHSRMKEIRAYGYDAMIRMLPEKRFIIFSRARSGSTLLVNLLKSHPDIHCDHELLHSKVGIFDTPRYLTAYAKRRGGTGYGCKILSGQLLMQRGESGVVLQKLVNDGWQIIHLKRQNIIRQAISAYIAHNRQIWKATQDNSLADYQIRIDPKYLMFQLMARNQFVHFEKSLLANLPHLPLIYEEHLLRAECHQTTADEVFSYLGFPSAPIRAPYKKIVPNNLREVIINYDEIEALIRRSKYTHLLDEM